MTADLQKDHQQWLDELALELRLRNVGGRQIGDAVATAREFLSDAHVPAEDAFGSPRTYAEELRLLPTGDDDDSLRRTVLHAAVDVLGFLALAFAGGAAWRGERFDLDAGTAVLVATVLVLVLLTPRLLPTILRAAPWKIFAGAFGLLAFQVAVLFPLDDVDLVTLPAWPVAAFGLLVLTGSVVRAWTARDELEDPIVEPLDEEPVAGRGLRAGQLFVMLPHLVSFVAAWGFVLLDVLTHG